MLHGKSQLAAPSRPFADETTVQHVVGKALEPFSEYSVKVLEVFPDADETPMKKSQFFPDDFEQVRLSELAAYGYFWVAHVQRTDGLSTPAAMAGPSAVNSSSSSVGSGLPDSLGAMMQRERGV